MSIATILNCQKLTNAIPESFQGLERQIISYISSYFLINKLDIDSVEIFQLIEKLYISGDKLAVEFFSLHKAVSSNYFDYSCDLDEYNRRTGTNFRNSIGLSANEPHLDMIFVRILREHFDLKFEPISFVLMSHDIDKTSYIESFGLLFKCLIGDLIKRKRFYPRRVVHFFSKKNVHLHLNKLFSDPFPRITLLLPKRDSMHADYDLVPLIKMLSSSDYSSHYGLHYSIQNSRTPSTLDQELSSLQKYLHIRFCRAHYLNRDPYCDNWLSKSQLIDLTPYDINSGGFYLPSSYPFFISNPNGSGIFSLNTTFMDVTYHFADISFLDKKKILSSYCNKVKLFGGIFVVNWHNTSFFWGNWINEAFNYDFLVSFLSCYFED